MEKFTAIATDLDGTLFDDKKQFNQELFHDVFTHMTERNIKFIVATGNPASLVEKIFADIKDNIGIVAANGANVLVNGKSIWHASIHPELLIYALDIISQIKGTSHIIFDGLENSYVKATIPMKEYQEILTYSPKAVPVVDLGNSFQDIFKITFKVGIDEVSKTKFLLNHCLKGNLVPVDSGYGDIDLVMPGVDKFVGIEKLLDYWHLNVNNLVSFGDNSNDIDMLEGSGYSFAMENGSTIAKKVADEVIGTNNDNQVLKTIEKLLEI